MRIVEIRERTIQLGTAVRNANIRMDAMTASAVAVVTDTIRNGKPLVGLAFDSIGRYGHGGLLRERFIPRLLEAGPGECQDESGDVIDPHRAWAVMMSNEKMGGHGERSGAVGLLDAALWDLVAKAADEPLWKLLARRHGTAGANGRLAVYASGGHYRPSDDIGGLRKDIRGAIADGYRIVKIKIGGATIDEDLKRIDAACGLLGSGMRLAVDGNGTFSCEKTMLYLERLGAYPLAWIEEPVHPLDFEAHRQLAGQAGIPIGTGENLFSCDDARNLIRYAGLRKDRDLLQFDISLSYGIVEYLRILAETDAQGWRRDRYAPHAGHLLAMHVVAGLGLGMAETAMGQSTLFGDVTAGLDVDDGTVTLPSAPGTGFEQAPAFAEIFAPIIPDQGFG